MKRLGLGVGDMGRSQGVLGVSTWRVVRRGKTDDVSASMGGGMDEYCSDDASAGPECAEPYS